MAVESYATACDACWLPRMAAGLLRARYVPDLFAPRARLAAMRASGASWKEIATAFGLTRPRQGPSDVRHAASVYWELAGSPGAPEPLTSDERRACGDTYREARKHPRMLEYAAARDAAVEAWLGAIARGDD